MSAEAVAEAADRTTGALYSHFGGKDGLLLALVEEWKEASAHRIVDRVEQSDDLDGRLRALWGGSDRNDWLLLEIELWLHAARDPIFADDLARHFDELRHGLGTALARWTTVEESDRTAGLVIALLMGLALQHRLDPTSVTGDDVVAALRALIERT